MNEPRPGDPLVSVLMVARNAARFIDTALCSVRVQTLRRIEIVVVDDGSIDDTARIVRDHARLDPRVRLLDGPRRGLSAVRNASLAAARARLVAILDADDLLHPRHLEWLLACQAASGAEICASNMISFAQSEDGVNAEPFAAEPRWRRGQRIGLEDFIRCGMIGTRGPSLGYLKPLFCKTFLLRHGIAYDERLRIGEDFDMVLRAMLAGARFEFVPKTTYFYRRHGQSISQRLTLDDVTGLIEATRGYFRRAPGLSPLLQARLDNLEGSRRQLVALDALRAGHMLEAVRVAARHRHARRLVISSLRESCFKRLGLWGAAHAGGHVRAGATLPAEHLLPLTRALRPAASLA